MQETNLRIKKCLFRLHFSLIFETRNETFHLFIKVIEKYFQTFKASNISFNYCSELSCFLESNRAPFAKSTLLEGIINDVSSDDPKLTLQAIRCLCNLCADNGQFDLF